MTEQLVTATPDACPVCPAGPGQECEPGCLSAAALADLVDWPEDDTDGLDADLREGDAVLALAEAAEPWSLRVTTLATGGYATAARFRNAMEAAVGCYGFFETDAFQRGDYTVSVYDRDRHVLTYSAAGGAVPVNATGYDDLVAATTDDPEHPALTSAQQRIAALRGE